ncbi:MULTISPECIES: transglycosylase SLT domain-containing protein [unclassified Bradyrhizobium]|uniref:transglycosylase SLT domain-containing protein n=1 Tax=unclassified Bradyrhizobium TaxID=2631580 RepID=UPI0004831A99|nr:MULTISPECIES: transglycosylase SLT domain-containing protein [unclassified Bradyrhizobium]MCP3466437.1 transglycosylase SLT domain-containing protein [Bradyrhizobium sp. CCGUVB23]
MRSCTRLSWVLYAAPLCLAVLAAGPVRAGAADAAAVDVSDAVTSDSVEAPSAADAEPFPARASVRALIEKEAAKTKLPPDIAEAVVFVESRFDSTVIGRVGEIGLMQVKPETAALLGFKGTTVELARPEINIHYGVIYLARAWRLAQGDLCRALMKYRAGHGEETMTARSVIYCNRARNRLIAMNSPFATPGATTAVAPDPEPARTVVSAKPQARPSPVKPTDVYATYKHGTAAASRAYWAAHEARVRAIKARIEAKWRRVASR